MFKSDFFIKNRQKLRQGFEPDDVFVFTANGLIQRSGSTAYAFRQDSSFWYLTGLDDPDILLLMQGGNEYLILPNRSRSYEVFNGYVDTRQLSKVSGVSSVLGNSEGLELLGNVISTANRAATLLPSDRYINEIGMYASPARQKLTDRLQSLNPKLELVDCRPHLAKLRMFKQPPEIEAIKKSVNLTCSTFALLKRNLKDYHTEADILRAIKSEYLSNRAAEAYDTIVAAGANACTLHYLPQPGKKLASNELVIVDTGAELNYYAADITRTYACGQPSARQLEVFAAVMAIRQFAIEQLKPGILMKQYEANVKEYVRKTLPQLGLANDVNKYYPHASSHFLGLDVHDAADYGTPLKDGCVLTVEPGIYIQSEGIGIRIEDDILITKNGVSNLSAELPHELV